MILNYRDRYGNEHSFDTENEICGIPGCKHKVAAITSGNMHRSKMYCESHMNGVEVECYSCHKKMIISCSDFMKTYPNKFRCKRCQIIELNQTDHMRKQAGDLGKRLFSEGKGMFSDESKLLANINSHTKEVCKYREETKRNNGFYEDGGGYSRGLKKRIENGSLQKWKNAGQTSEAHAKQNITRWNNMNEIDKEKEIERLKSIGFTPSFKNENGILYYFDKSARQYVPWDEYKLRFVRKRITRDVESFMQSVKSLPLFQPKHMGPADSYDIDEIIQIIPTFREQDIDTWNGARNAFEEYLKELDVRWFTYVKFYVNGNNQIRPLVVGKSGSMLVNAGGSDVNFSMNENDGPARRFLMDEGYHWDRTKLMILKAKSEKQALYWEWYLQKQYQLFES